MNEDEAGRSGIHAGVMSATPWEAAMIIVRDVLGDNPVPGTKINVLTDGTGLVSEFTVDDDGNVVPVR